VGGGGWWAVVGGQGLVASGARGVEWSVVGLKAEPAAPSMPLRGIPRGGHVSVHRRHPSGRLFSLVFPPVGVALIAAAVVLVLVIVIVIVIVIAPARLDLETGRVRLDRNPGIES
jgi:hypothetical protein